MMTKLEQSIMLEISTLPKSRLPEVLTYVRFIKLGLADSAEIEKRFDNHGSRCEPAPKN